MYNIFRACHDGFHGFHIFYCFNTIVKASPTLHYGMEYLSFFCPRLYLI